MRERSDNLQSIEQLNELNQQLQLKFNESQSAYKDLMEAKDEEATKFNAGIEKLFKFKAQVKDLLAKDKQELEELKQANDKLWKENQEREQMIKQLQKDAKEAIEQKA